SGTPSPTPTPRSAGRRRRRASVPSAGQFHAAPARTTFTDTQHRALTFAVPQGGALGATVLGALYGGDGVRIEPAALPAPMAYHLGAAVFGRHRVALRPGEVREGLQSLGIRAAAGEAHGQRRSRQQFETEAPAQFVLH